MVEIKTAEIKECLQLQKYNWDESQTPPYIPPVLAWKSMIVCNLKDTKQERKGFRSMIASSQFNNLQSQICNLATWQLGNLVIWQFGILAIWQFGNLATQEFGNLARNAELTFNFGNFQNWELSILATFNFGSFQFNSSKILPFSKKY